jgi:hypothetical protein
MTLGNKNTPVRIEPRQPTRAWRRDTWAALTLEGKRQAWDIMTPVQRDRLREALEEPVEPEPIGG